MALLGGLGGCDVTGDSASLVTGEEFESLETQAISSLLSLLPPTVQDEPEPAPRSYAATCCHTSTPGTPSTLEPEVKSTLKSIRCLNHGVLSQQQVQYYCISIFATS